MVECFRYFHVEIRFHGKFANYDHCLPSGEYPEIAEIIQRLRLREDILAMAAEMRTNKARKTSDPQVVLEDLREIEATPEVVIRDFEPSGPSEIIEDLAKAIAAAGLFFHEAGDLEGCDPEDWDDELLETNGFGYDHYEKAIYDYGDYVEHYDWCYNSHGSTRVSRVDKQEFLKRLAEIKDYLADYEGWAHYQAWKKAQGYLFKEEDQTNQLATWG